MTIDTVADTQTLHVNQTLGDNTLHNASNIAILYGPLILATTFAIVTGSYAGLRNWIALQAAPVPQQVEGSGKKHKRLIFLAHVAKLSIVGLAVWCYWNKIDVKVTSPWWLVCLVPLISGPTFRMLADVTRSINYSAHRTIRGRGWIRPIKGQKMAKVFLVAVSLANAAGALYYNSGGCLLIGFASTTYLVSRGHFRRNVRLGVMLHLLFLTSVIISSADKLGAVQRLLPPTRDATSVEDKINAFIMNWLIPSVGASTPGIILALLLRFDYRRHLEQNPEDQQALQLESVPVHGACLKKRLGDGVVVPVKAPRFHMAYFRTAITAWMLSQILALSLMIACSKQELVGIHTTHYMTKFVTFGTKAIYGSVLLRAWFRGELRALLAYREAWRAAPEPVASFVDAEEEKARVNEKTPLIIA